MKNAIVILIVISSVFLISFPFFSRGINKDELKTEIKQVEKAFQETLNKQGAAEAFYQFASEEAVVLRGRDSIIMGKEGIRNFYSDSAYINAYAEWAPDFIDISNDGTLAYTYGKYQWKFSDSTGKTTSFSGVFHTVWKRQKDGSWKYVWD